MSILKAFGEECLSRTEAETKFLGRFITEVSAAHDAGRKPFQKVRPTFVTVGEVLKAYVQYFRKHAAGDLASIPDANLKSRCLFIDRELGSMPMAEAQTEEAMADFKAGLLGRTKKDGTPKALATANRVLCELRTMFGWAKARKFATNNPFHRHGVKVETAGETRKLRRLHEGEEARLLNAAALMNTPRYQFAGERFRGCIIGAVDTGMRAGEQMRAQVEDVMWDGREGTMLNVPFYKLFRGKMKRNSKYEREVPIPITPRLYDEIVGKKDFGPKAYLFGDAQGNHVEKFVTSWNTLNLLAHGFTSNRDKHHGRSAADKEALVAIDLDWRDIRHEAISRWAEADGENGEPLFDPQALRQLAGHKNFQTTLRYINARPGRLRNQMKKFVKATQPAQLVTA